MTTHTQRRVALGNKLRAAKDKHSEDFTNRCQLVAMKVGVSNITVRNYMNGNVADGYLGEDILSAWNSLGKKVNNHATV